MRRASARHRKRKEVIKMKKVKELSVIITAIAMAMLISVPCFAETVGDSSGNVPTGVQLDWLPLAICGGALLAAVIVLVVTMIMKKKKNK